VGKHASPEENPVQTLIVLFRLKPGIDRAAYEQWARTTDLPIVRKLPSIERFDVYRVAGLFGSDGAAPYDYVELLDVSDQGQFITDVSTDTMRRVAGEFRQFADNPVFMLTGHLEDRA
jgi:hypothetical protein